MTSGGQEQRLGLAQTWAAESPGSYPLFCLLPSHADKIEGDNRMPCAPPQEGGHVVMGHFPGGTAARGSGGPAPVEVTGDPGGKRECPPWSRRGL